MICLPSAAVRNTLVVAAMATIFPAIVFAQTSGSTIEKAPVRSEAAVTIVSSNSDKGSTDENTSVEAGPPTKIEVGIERLIEVESQRRFNELRSKLLDDRANTIGWWLTAMTVVLGFFGIVAVVGGYIGFDRFRTIEIEAKEAVGRADSAAERADSHAKDAERYVGEIERNRDKSDEMLRNWTAETAEKNPDETKQVIDEVLDNPEATAIDKATVRAFFLQKAGKKEEAIEIWRAIADFSTDKDRKAMAWSSVGYLLEDTNLKIEAYDESLRLRAGNPAAYVNRGAAKQKLGRYADAIFDYTDGIRREKSIARYGGRDPEKLVLFRAYRNRGDCKVALGHPDKARADFEEALGVAQKTSNVELISEIKQRLDDFD